LITCKTLFLSMGLCLPVVASAAAQTSSAPAAAPAVSPETLDAMFQRMDKNDDKMLSLDEFKAGIVARERAIVLVRLQAQFKSMDKNNSGALEPTEFYELPLMKSGGSNVPTFTAADTDRDQKLNFKEYVALVGKYAASRQPARKP
jgi:Ca2+-binding EF-hand superfamily protein